MVQASVSIIMPSLNVVKYISECMESVLNQSLQDIEVLCIDAGSTDGTLQILQEYAKKDNRIRIINSPIKSYGYQLNLGIEQSTGEYIGIVESDDLIDSNMFEELYAKAKAYNLDFIKGAYVQFATFASECMEIRYINPNVYGNLNSVIDLTVDWKKGLLDPVHIWSGLYRKDFLLKKNIRLNETPGASYQDTSFSLLVGLLADSCMYVDEYYYHYRIDNENSSVKSDKKYDCVIDEYVYLEKVLREQNAYSLDVQIEILKYKLQTYRWNYMRLSDKSRELFLQLIQGEMKEYITNKVLNMNLNEEEKEIVQLLTDEEVRVENSVQEKKRIEKFRQLIQFVLKSKNYIVVGAGNCCSPLLLLQGAMGRKFIDAICDNDSERWGMKKGQYIITDVKTTVDNNPDALYIIANKNHSRDISTQLQKLGINKENMFALDLVASPMELVDLYKGFE